MNTGTNDYLVAAFVLVWFILLLYVAVVALRTARMSREVELLSRLANREQTPQPPNTEG